VQQPAAAHVAIPTDELRQLREASSTAVAAAANACSAAAEQPADAGRYTQKAPGSGSSSAAAAAAALASARQLPGVREQLWVVVVRCGRKWVSSRQNLMTDLLLTALLGLALGAAQVR
jgi:hypothetical protein